MSFIYKTESVSNRVRVRIIADDDPVNPCREYDQFGKMVCFHDRYHLGHETPDGDAIQYLISLAASVLPNGELSLYRKYRAPGETWEDIEYTADWVMEDRIRADPEKLYKVIDRHFLLLPLYLYDHSGLTMRTSAFSCPWDSGQVGFIFASKGDAIKEFGKGTRLTAKARESAFNCLCAEVAEYDHYLTGNCWGYQVQVLDTDGDPGDDSCWQDDDSCWGFLGDPEYCLREGLHVARYVARDLANSDAEEFAARATAARPDMYLSASA